MEPLVPINSIDELKKILFLQRVITQAAKDELLAIAHDQTIRRDPKKFIDDAKQLLEKYAKYPTLTEFRNDPELANAYKWGATFGVATLVAATVLAEVQTLQPHFSPVLRQMFFLLMRELDQPEHEYLIDPLVAALRVQVMAESGEATPQQQLNYVRHLMNELAETFVQVGVQFGLMTLPDGKNVALTHIGQRVLMHLADAAKFIDEMQKAHTKFQAIKPKLSMA